jgi:hypothetical protein
VVAKVNEKRGRARKWTDCPFVLGDAVVKGIPTLRTDRCRVMPRGGVSQHQGHRVASGRKEIGR